MSNEVSEMMDMQISSPMTEEVQFGTPVETEKTEQQTETKTEVQEVKTEETVTEKKEEVKTSEFFDKFKKTDPTTVATETKTNPIKQEAVISPEIQVKLQRLESFEKSPVAKLLNGDFDLTKINLAEWLQSAAGENFQTFSNDQLLLRTLQGKYKSLSSEEIQEEVTAQMERFNELPLREQKMKREEMVEGLSAAQPQSDVFKTLTEIQEKQRNQPDVEAVIKERNQNAYTDMQGYFQTQGSALVGQKYGEYEVTKEDAAAIVQAFEALVNTSNPEEALFHYFRVATYDNAVSAAEKRGYEKAVKEKANPSRNDSSQPVIMTKDSAGMKGASQYDFFEQAQQ